MVKEIVGINRQFYDWTREGPWITTDAYIDFNVTREDDTLFIKFQESQGFKNINGWNDWLRNINFFFKYEPFLRVFVHEGFLKGWANCSPSIFRELWGTSVLQNVKKIIISGNSQGSDVGLICTAYLMDMLEDIPSIEFECYAFTPSRIWWCLLSWRLNKYFNKNNNNVHLIIAHGDPASRLPPAWWGYGHKGIKHYVGDPKAKVNVDHHRPEIFRMYLPEVKINNNDS